MNSGIYKITVGEYKYIGRSSQLNKRKSDHKRMFKNGNHSNPILRNAFAKYNNWEWEVIKYAPVEKLVDLEQYYIDLGDNCNIKSAVPGSLPGEFSGDKHHMWGKTRSPEVREKISKANRGKKRDKPAWNKGTSKVYIWDKDGWRFECSAVELCNNFNLHDGSLCRITNGKRKTYKGFKCVACVIG